VAARELASVAPDGAVVLVADIDSWGAAFEDAARTGAQLLPFPERDGVYWGPPADDAGAIAELDRLRDAGAAVLAFGPGTSWWLEYYEGFERHLRRHYDLLIETPRLRAFDLRDSRTAPRDA
jgi:hypothetical protein